MLRSLKEMTHFDIVGIDDSVGRVHDFYFDNCHWIVRYAVASTSLWLPGRKVLISPDSFLKPDWDRMMFNVNLTRNQIKDSPEIKEHEPVSKQMEHDLANYYSWPVYWSSNPMGAGFIPPMSVDRKITCEGSEEHCLRSVKEVTGYHIKASDGSIGHIEDFLAEDDTWIIRYALVKTKNILPGKHVIIAPDWIQCIDWDRKEVEVKMSKEAIENSPEYDIESPLVRHYEETLHDHYGHPRYWTY